MNTESFVLVCKALGDAHRLEIVNLLSSGEACACKVLEYFSITQPTLSHHMKILCESNLVKVRKEGKWSHYSLNCELFEEFRQFVGTIVCSEQEGTQACQ